MRYGTKKLVEVIPSKVEESDVIKYMHTYYITYSLFNLLNKLYHNNIDRLAGYFDLTPRTLRNYITRYKKTDIIESGIYKEKAILLVSLFKHGSAVFGNESNFLRWLEQENYFFNNLKPAEFMNTVSGIHLVDSRLTAIEYGDNA